MSASLYIPINIAQEFHPQQHILISLFLLVFLFFLIFIVTILMAVRWYALLLFRLLQKSWCLLVTI